MESNTNCQATLYGTGAKKEKESQVQVELNILGEACNALTDITDRLVGRLIHVITPVPPEAVDPSTDIPELVILAGSIRHESNRIIDLNRILNSLINRIEL